MLTEQNTNMFTRDFYNKQWLWMSDSHGQVYDALSQNEGNIQILTQLADNPSVL